MLTGAVDGGGSEALRASGVLLHRGGDCVLRGGDVQVASGTDVGEIKLLTDLQRGVVDVVGTDNRSLPDLALNAAVPLLRVRIGVVGRVDAIADQSLADEAGVGREGVCFGCGLVLLL